MKKLFLAVALIALTAACGEDSPTAPSEPQYPQVAGTYRGTLTWTVDGVYMDDTQMTVVVTQTGSTINLTSTVLGSSSNASGTIDTNGHLTITSTSASSNPQYVPGCGYMRPVSGDYNFAGNSLSWINTLRTDWCGEWKFSGTLYR